MVKKRKHNKKLEEISFKITSWIGTPISIIIHTLFFGGIFLLGFLGVDTESILLILTTAVSLEAIYLAIFIQMSVNRQASSIASLEDDLEDIQDDVEDISEDVEDISEDIDQIQAEDDNEEQTQITLTSIEKQLQSVQKELQILHHRGVI